MNIFYYKTGELIMEGKKYELTSTENKILFILINNKINTYEEIYKQLYGVEVIGKLDRQLTRNITTHICRLRKKGLNIQVKYDFGMRLLDNICLQY